MQIDLVLVAIVIAIVLFLTLLVSVNYGRPEGSTSFPVLSWIGLTLATFAAGAIASFVGVNVLYFVGGAGAGAVGLAATIAFFVATPIVWALILRRRGRHVSAHR